MRYIEKIRRVLGGHRSGAENVIVARELALDAHSFSGHPGERIEPVHGAGELCAELRQAVAALNVRQLMKQNVATLPVGPVASARRYEKRRMQESPGHRNR